MPHLYDIPYTLLNKCNGAKTTVEPQRQIEQKPFNTLELVTMQNELLHAIGDTLNAREMMHSFMQSARKTIGLDSIHLYAFTENERHQQKLQHDIAVPHGDIRPHNIDIVMQMLQQFAQTEIKSYQLTEYNNKFYLGYCFNPYGVLLLEKNEVFAHSIPDAMLSVFNKLAKHYQFCLQHKELKDQINSIQDIRNTYEKQAKQDPLTNLPNRREFRYALFQEINKSQRYKVYGALLYIDLDNFKNINDSLGHSVGDILLTQIAERLKSHARSGDNVYRIGGDEFVYILSNIGDTQAAAMHKSQNVATRILETMADPVVIGEYSLHITPSIGIAIFPEANSEENDSESVLKHADAAMYRAKSQGRNRFEFFDPEMQIEANKRLIIEDHLRKALVNNELHLVYQPIIDKNKNIVGAESLIRWNNPILGKITPDDFVHIAEESNLILKLSDWIVRKACEYGRYIYEQLPEDSPFKYISINISPRQFMQQDFVDSILSIIDETGVPSHFIKLEFTENILAQNIDLTIGKMNKLIDNGIEFLLDDFGTGYSSLSYLHRLPVRILKIDKSFISNVEECSNDQKAIVEAILVMSEELGINCLTEGVETKSDYEFFSSKNIYGMQGYYFYTPMIEESLSKLLLEKTS